MSSNNRNISEDENSRKGEGVSGLGKGSETRGVAGGADNTRGENKPGSQGSSGGAKQGREDQNQQRHNNAPAGNYQEKGDSPQGSNANPTTTSRGADSTDKEFRNNQPNASTLKGMKNSAQDEDK